MSSGFGVNFRDQQGAIDVRLACLQIDPKVCHQRGSNSYWWNWSWLDMNTFYPAYFYVIQSWERWTDWKYNYYPGAVMPRGEPKWTPCRQCMPSHINGRTNRMQKALGFQRRVYCYPFIEAEMRECMESDPHQDNVKWIIFLKVNVIYFMWDIYVRAECNLTQPFMFWMKQGFRFLSFTHEFNHDTLHWYLHQLGSAPNVAGGCRTKSCQTDYNFNHPDVNYPNQCDFCPFMHWLCNEAIKKDNSLTINIRCEQECNWGGDDHVDAACIPQMCYRMAIVNTRRSHLYEYSVCNRERYTLEMVPTAQPHIRIAHINWVFYFRVHV